jgi:hypothetical protein
MYIGRGLLENALLGWFWAAVAGGAGFLATCRLSWACLACFFA